MDLDDPIWPQKCSNKFFEPTYIIQRDLSGSSECRRLVDNLIGGILDWNQRLWNENVLNFFVRSSDWQKFKFCNHFWGKIGNGDVFLPILGLRAGLVSIMHYCRWSLALIHLHVCSTVPFFSFSNESRTTTYVLLSSYSAQCDIELYNITNSDI